MNHYRRTFIRRLFALTLAANLFAAGFAQATQSSAIDAATRQQVIQGAIKALNDAYVFPETAKKMEQAIRDRAGRKEYDEITDGRTLANRLTQHLQEVSKDKHLRVIFNDGSSPFFTQQMADPATRREMSAKRNFSFEKVERLNGNVGYVDLRGFEPPDLAGETATAAMNFLANTDALIFDLRQNGGGDPAMVAFLCSYFFNERTHLNDIYSRPDNHTQSFWTRETVPGKRYGADKPVFVLTSNRTFSGAEEFSYNLKNLKRATIIGETTGGGAHPVRPQRMGKDFLITVPFARSINPITKTNWEGTGVTPDIDLPAPQALKAAHLLAVRAIQPKITQPMLADQLKTLASGLQRELDEAKIALPPSLNLSAVSSVATSSSTPSREVVTASQSPASHFEMPKTPAGKVLGNFLTSLNSGSLETMKKFHQETGGDVENAEKDFGLYQQSGGLNPLSIARSTEFEIEVLVQGKKDGRWLSFSMGVEPAPPHGIAEIRIRPTSASATDGKSEPRVETTPASTVKKSEAKVLQELPSWIDKEAAGDHFSGVVLIAKGKNPIFQKAVGLADKAKKAPNQINTKFNLGSINKIFTQIAINQLIEQGKLSWEAKVGKFLPDYPNKDAREKVTVRHLVEFQSGIGDFFGPKFDATPKERIRTINDYLPLFADKPLAFEPGTSRAYSNGGYLVLGAIIEKITGQTYYDYVREHIYKPAGMADTDCYISGAGTPNMAEGYRRNEKGERVNNVDTRPGRGSSAGGGYSTAEDLLKFANALREYKLLSPEGSRRILGRAGIAGGAPGINAELEIGSGYTIIVLGNYDPPNASNVSRHIRNQLIQDQGNKQIIRN
jgi:CubicO group peptidase (beta-lactamase class C family)